MKRSYGIVGKEKSDKMNSRHVKILELITEYKKMEVTKLSELLEVSQVTIRKDLDALESNEMIIREHGYATLNNKDDINNRLALHYDVKQKIAAMVVKDIEDGETIMIESGSCCALVAKEIAETKKDVTLITNSAFIADYIRKVGTVKIILLGGEYQSESQVMVGPMMRQCASAFFVDKLFVGTDGFTYETGFTGKDYMRAVAVSDMARQATQVMIVSDSEKFSQKGTVSLVELNKIHTIYTDECIPNDMENYFIEHNINVKKANKKERSS